MIVCDTGPLVAAALSKDPDHHRSVELFTGMHLAGRTMLVPAPVVAEVGYLLGTRAGARAESIFLRGPEWTAAAGSPHDHPPTSPGGFVVAVLPLTDSFQWY